MGTDEKEESACACIKHQKNETELVLFFFTCTFSCSDSVLSYSSWDNVTLQMWCSYPLISQSLNLVSSSD